MRVDHVAYQKASRVAVLGLLLQLAAGLTLLLYGRAAGDTTFMVASWYGFAGIPVWACLAVVFHQHRLERLEAMEREELVSSRGDATIFERSAPDQEAAARRLRLMHHWLVPGVSLGVAAVLGLVGWFNLANLRAMDEPGAEVAFQVGGSLGWQVAVCLSIALVAFIFARFVAGMSRQPAWQNLRGGAGFMVGVALVALATAVGIVFHVFQRPAVLQWVATGLAVGQMVMAAEILLNAILNLYRPRRAGETPRPAFDSRVLGLLAAPDNLVRGINEAVNYQFGFDIASSWGYKLLLRSGGGLLALGVVALVALSCVVVVGPGQQAVRLRGGGLVGRVYQGEVMFKLPWPFETAELVDMSRVRSLPLQGKGLKVGQVNLWSEAQENEERRPYIVAAPRLSEEVRKDLGAGSAAQAATPVPVPGGMQAAEEAVEAQLSGISSRFALVDADLVLNWRIKPEGLMDWLGFASDARIRKEGLETREVVLREIARREVSQFLGTQPLDQVLSPSGAQLATSLRERLQASFDRQGTGVQVVSIQIPGLRPPGEAATLYEELSIDVQNARKVKEEAQRLIGASMAKLLGDARLADGVVQGIDRWRTLTRERGESDPETVSARRAVEGMLANSRGMIATQIRQAQARRWALHMDARRTASEVLGQAAAFHAAPRLFMERRIMETLARSVASVRQKYVLGVDPAKVRLDIQMQQPDSGLNLADYLEKKE
jgi:regulator of protease activity HflC (stomatin/prohibitin superfamily)